METGIIPSVNSSVQENENEHSCSCKKSTPDFANQFIYSIGKLSVKFPSLGIEKEFLQREAAIFRSNENADKSTSGRITSVLKENHHLAKAVTFIQSVTGIPAYVVIPTGLTILDKLTESISDDINNDSWQVIIGRRGNIASPSLSGGILAPELHCDVLYSFKPEDLINSLIKPIEPLLKQKKWSKEEFHKSSIDLFYKIANMPDNLGSLDGHRALNYMSIQHTGLYISAMELSKNHFLQNIDTRLSEGPAGQKIVTVIMRFISRLTGISEDLAAKIDVTEEWPFVVSEVPHQSPPLVMVPYVNSNFI
jgi:hypothetical protein